MAIFQACRCPSRAEKKPDSLATARDMMLVAYSEAILAECCPCFFPCYRLLFKLPNLAYVAFSKPRYTVTQKRNLDVPIQSARFYRVGADDAVARRGQHAAYPAPITNRLLNPYDGTF